MSLQNSPVVMTKEGAVKGVEHPGSTAFLGIPYAEAPVGDLRFDAPKKRAPWEGVLDATEYGPTGLLEQQVDTLIPEPAIPGDDILNLNVFTPTLDPADPLPVFVWIHGGGFSAGSPAGPWYDGRSFNRDDVVVVTLNYRLGFEGFGAVPGKPVNRGVLDWIAALTWVQRNILVFGGDPSRVTIGGQSAGGTAVLTLLALPEAQHLFHSVWSSSPPHVEVQKAAAVSKMEELAAALEIPPTSEGFESRSRLEVYRAQTKSAKLTGKGLALLRQVASDSIKFGPTLDGELIKKPLLEALIEGVGSDKPLIIGANIEEFTFFLTPMKTAFSFLPTSAILSAVGLSKRVAKQYLEDNDDARTDGKALLAGHLLTDLIFRVNVQRTAIARARGKADKAGTWLYSFEWPTPVHGMPVHCLDIPFLFDCLADPKVPSLVGDNPPVVLASELHGAAVDFIRDSQPDWPKWNTDNQITRIFDASPTADVEGSVLRAHLRRYGYASCAALV